MKRIKTYHKFNEDHAQMNLPFREKQYKGKTIHEDLTDALTDMQVMEPGLYKSKGNPRDEFDKVEDAALLRILKGDTGGIDSTVIQEYLYPFLESNPVKENPEYYNKKTLKELTKEDKDVLSDVATFSEAASKLSDVKTLFSKEGWESFLRLSKDKFDEDTYEMEKTIQNSFDKNDGLIEVWRTINYEEGVDNYEKILKGYGGVGVYWAWDKSAAEAYWGGSGRSITLYGKVSVENVNWLITTEAGAYGLREEKELRVKDGGDIMVVGFNDDKLNKYIELEEGPYVVKSTHSRKLRKKKEKLNPPNWKNDK